MTFEELMKHYYAAKFKVPSVPDPEGGVYAVVEQLRNNVILEIDAHKGIGILATEKAIDATRDVFNKILGPCIPPEPWEYKR